MHGSDSQREKPNQAEEPTNYYTTLMLAGVLRSRRNYDDVLRLSKAKRGKFQVSWQTRGSVAQLPFSAGAVFMSALDPPL